MGTVLLSQTTGRKWKVKSRILFDHAEHIQKKFENETTNFMLMRFSSENSLQVSLNGIRNRESKLIYQYLVAPVQHDFKPEEGEMLKIQFKNNDQAY